MVKKPEKRNLTIVIGSGFSKEAGLSTTSSIPKIFLSEPKNSDLPPRLEKKISEILRKYWEQVFGYKEGSVVPTLEDHFTLLDLAANSGHHLGRDYSPKCLRAVRRMSIHRVFQLLVENGTKKFILNFLKNLDNHFSLSIVTLNWDLVVERHLKKENIKFHYPIETFKLAKEFAGESWKRTGVPIMKMHGSINWVYCDSCRRIYSGKTVGHAITRKTFLEADDFELFESGDNLRSSIEKITKNRECPHCSSILAGRVATFSYRKAFSIAHFQSIWERAHDALRKSDMWLIAGYSMPAADFEFLHLLKSAQLARKRLDKLNMRVIIQGREETKQRYQGFFGLKDADIRIGGLRAWIENEMDEFIREYR